ncbi:MAG: amidohydrolase family protein [Planctomycetes bacterium]|nr:amidohydrolase family protein [Planctomycetota bacterium]
MNADYVDFHVHMPYKCDVEPFVRAARKAGIAMCVNACGPMWGQDGNDAVQAAASRYPDTVIPIGYVGLGRGDGPWTVDDLRSRGFRGLKVIGPTRDYDDPEFFPVYARAEALRMPVLFHTGVVARNDQMLKAMLEAGKPVPPHGDPRTFNISSKRMEPMCVDGILRAFPDLDCVLAHFGSTGRRDVSEGIIRWNPNAYGDMTSYSWAFELDDSAQGWHIEQKHVDMFAERLRPLFPAKYAHKLLYATDVTTDDPALLDAKLESHRAVYSALGIGTDARKLMFRDTALRLLGLD